MKQNIINILCLVSLLSVANAGVVKNERACYNHDGKEIPCKLMVTKKEDYGFKAIPKKRGLFGDGLFGNRNSGGLFGGLFGGHSHNNDNSFDDHTHDNTDDDFSTETNWNTDNSSTQYLTQTHTNEDDLNSSWNTGNNNNDDSNTHTHTHDDDDTGFGTNWNTGNDDSGFGNNWNTGNDNTSFGNNWNTGNDDTSFGNNWNTGDDDSTQVNTNDNFDNWDFGNTQNTWSDSSTGSSTLSNIDYGLDDEGVIRDSYGSKITGSSTYTGSVKLPINGLTMTDFHGCTSEETSTLQFLIDDITTYRAAAYYVLNHLDEDPMFEQIFLKYFHDHDHLSHIQKIFGLVNSMSVAEAYCEPGDNGICGEKAIAYSKYDGTEFHVCPHFFTLPMYGTINDRQSEAAAIILHELTHSFNTVDNAYGEAKSQALDSEKASNNADTYRLFAMKCIYYLNERGSGKSFKKMMISKDEKIDFRSTPFMDVVLPADHKSSNYKRNFEDFLNENIDFREIPVKDKVYDRPERQ